MSVVARIAIKTPRSPARTRSQLLTRLASRSRLRGRDRGLCGRPLGRRPACRTRARRQTALPQFVKPFDRARETTATMHRRSVKPPAGRASASCIGRARPGGRSPRCIGCAKGGRSSSICRLCRPTSGARGAYAYGSRAPAGGRLPHEFMRSNDRSRKSSLQKSG